MNSTWWWHIFLPKVQWWVSLKYFLRILAFMFKNEMDSQVSLFPTSFTIQIIPGKLINELGQASVDISVFIIRLIYMSYKQQNNRDFQVIQWCPQNPNKCSVADKGDRRHLSPLELIVAQHCLDWQSSLCVAFWSDWRWLTLTLIQTLMAVFNSTIIIYKLNFWILFASIL